MVNPITRTIGESTAANVMLYDAAGQPILTSGGALQTISLSALVPLSYDALVFGYTGSNLTQIDYKLNGSIVATLILGYTGSQLTSVQKA